MNTWAIKLKMSLSHTQNGILSVNLTKHVKDLCTENYKMLMK